MTEAIAIAGGDTAKPLNLRKRVNLILSRHSGSVAPKFLDCGCGAGEYVATFSEHGWDAYGVEFLPEKIVQARAAGHRPERIVQGDLQNLEYESASFDALMFNEVLEHVPDDDIALAEAYRIAKPAAEVFIFSPNRLYPCESHGVYLKATGRKLPVWMPFVPYVPLPLGRLVFRYWARDYWPWELRRKVRAAGFRIVDTGYVWQTFEGISNNNSGTLATFRPVLRKFSGILETLPLVKCFGVSQFIYAVKP